MGASKIFITDINDYRLNVAKKHGAFRTINVLNDDLQKIIDVDTKGLGIDSVICPREWVHSSYCLFII